MGTTITIVGLYGEQNDNIGGVWVELYSMVVENRSCSPKWSKCSIQEESSH